VATAWCPERQSLYCDRCATEHVEDAEPFWCWTYTLRYGCPWCGQAHAGLDRLEHDGMPCPPAHEISDEPFLLRYPEAPSAWHVHGEPGDEDALASWNANARTWDAGYDDDGDRNRRFQSDEPMLAMLGDVAGLDVLDVGSGNGYLCRKLARAGARMTGVELSDAFLDIARARESDGIRYVHASVSAMPLPDGSFDRAVSNYVLMDVPDYQAALAEVHRVLRPGGLFVAVICHPAFACGPQDWHAPAPDSPRPEERAGWVVDGYFRRGPYESQWGGLKPVLSFHRPLRDYWREFRKAGFTVEDFEEPSITERGRRELPPSRVATSLRVPWSCVFGLRRRNPSSPSAAGRALCGEDGQSPTLS